MAQTGQRIGIIGAGVTGLAAAWDCARAGHHVEIFEAQERVGGLAAGFKDPAWEWDLEKFYHHWFETDQDLKKLLDELGTREKLLFLRPKTSYWLNGKITRSEMNLSTLFLPISPLAKLRLGLWGVYLKLTRNWQALEKTTAHTWMQNHFGTEAYDRFFRPLLIGKFGEQYQQVNMAWLWARIFTRSVKLGTYQGGFQAFLDDLAAALQAQGVQIHLKTPVESLTHKDGQPAVVVDGQTHSFDRLLTTTSPALLLKHAPELHGTPYGQQVANLQSIGALCVVLALKQPLMPDGETYWLNLPATTPDKSTSQFPFLALVEHTNFLDKAHYNGETLVYCGDYVPADHEYFQMSEAALVERFLPALKKVNPSFTAAWVKRWWVWRAAYAQPVPGVNHSQKLPALQTPLPGVYWASMSHVYPWDRGTNYAIELGRRVARHMLEA